MNVLSLITQYCEALCKSRGVELDVTIDDGFIFLSDCSPFDSLDLAVIVTDCSVKLGVDPFKSGFKEFRTAGELAGLFEFALKSS